MTRLVLVSVTLALSSAQVLLAAVQEGGQSLLKEDFNDGGDREFVAMALKHEHIELAKGAGPDGSDAIRVTYVGYERGSQRVLFGYPLKAAVESATLSFDVRFSTDFQWVHGGKLHGLGPKHPITGGRKREPASWSARIMFKQNGRCSTYLYEQSKTKKYGIGDSSARPVFVAGQWHHVVLQLSLNEPGKSNGFARILVDNRSVVMTDNVCFRGTGGPHTLIQHFLFNTFHGGHDLTWTPVDEKGNPATVNAYFDNILVTEGIEQDKSSALGRPRH